MAMLRQMRSMLQSISARPVGATTLRKGFMAAGALLLLLLFALRLLATTSITFWDLQYERLTFSHILHYGL